MARTPKLRKNWPDARDKSECLFRHYNRGISLRCGYLEEKYPNKGSFFCVYANTHVRNCGHFKPKATGGE